MDVSSIVANTGVDLEIAELICEIEEKHGHEVHMAIEPIYNDHDLSSAPSWWVEFKDIIATFHTLEEVRTFFLEECEA